MKTRKNNRKVISTIIRATISVRKIGENNLATIHPINEIASRISLRFYAATITDRISVVTIQHLIRRRVESLPVLVQSTCDGVTFIDIVVSNNRACGIRSIAIRIRQRVTISTSSASSDPLEVCSIILNDAVDDAVDRQCDLHDETTTYADIHKRKKRSRRRLGGRSIGGKSQKQITKKINKARTKNKQQQIYERK
jgi:hypothetical protein